MRQPIILAVDDKPDNLFVLCQCINQYIPECTVITARSAEEGLSVAAGNPLDAALIDLQMPGMDGIEMCRRLKANEGTAHIPVLIMTAHRTSSKLRASALEAGADDFVSKPVDNVELAARIKVILRIKKAEDDLREINERLEDLVVERSKALQKSEASFQVVADALPVLIAHIDSEQRYRFANATYERYLWGKSSEMIGRTVADVLGERLYGQLKPNIDLALSGRSVEYREKLLLRDGRSIDCHIQYIPQRSDEGKTTGCFVLAQDITEKRQVEEERKATIELLALMNSSNSVEELIREVTRFLGNWTNCEAVGVRLRNGCDYPYFETRGFPPEFVQAENLLCTLDDSGEPMRDGTGNPVLECMCGNVVCGRSDPDMPFFTQFGSFYTNSTSELLANSTEQERQARTRNRCNGEGYESVALIPVRTGETTLGLLQLNDRRKNQFSRESIEFLERIAANLAISLARRQSEDERLRLTKAVDQAKESFVLANWDLKISYVNPAFERCSGYSLDQVSGRDFRCLENVGYADAFGQEVWNRVRQGHTWSGRIECISREGAPHQCDTTISPIVDAAGDIREFVIIMRDVSELVQLERQLRQVQKMDAIGTLAGGIAHDFNNILAPIIGYTEMVITELAHDDPKRRDLDQVLKASHRAKDLVKQILSFSRRTDQQRRPLLINPIVREALKLMRSTLPSTIQIRENIPPEMKESTVLADPTQLHQILVNLCTNAEHAMHDRGGVLEVSLAQVEFDREACPATHGLAPGSYVRLSVRDTGHGMEPEVVHRVFEPFFTTKTPGKGTGLGLSVVYGIVKDHGGSICVQSKPGEGSVFDVFLPRTVDKAKAQTVAPLPQMGKSERILLVDDEREVAEMTRRVLERLSYQVVMKTDSVEAARVFRSDPEGFDLVITDQTMPHKTGAELARELLSIRPDIPIILCTGFSDLVNEHKAKSLGIRGFLMKPAEASDMAKAIRKAIETSDPL